ncbi:M81 family metallopeptidase [Arthrobacter sp. JCM 19049]|uniref:M81 family metallopeptidase n=1 Tax=Arthrobacter sp. JCM 19049 TaxID=1460643 RepID=UPI0006D0E5E9|nr:M81 family metallopeptidase [Arthrobacter sp. JCM 19049]
MGYAWADEPRCYATVVVTGDDAELIGQQATELSKRYWQARADFKFVAPAAPWRNAWPPRWPKTRRAPT